MSSSTSSRASPRNPDDIFAEYFEVSNPPNTTFYTSNSRNANDVFSEFFGGSSPRKGAAIERPLACSLEDLYTGFTKKMQISRNVFLSDGRSTKVDEILKIEIKPGWKKGTKMTFPEKGSEERGMIPSDLVIIIDEKPHNLFKRDGNDLIVTLNISIAEALTGYTIQLSTLDGRNLTIPIKNVITPNFEHVVKGEGMPISKEPTKKGDLKIKFNIKFPTRLASEQKELINRAFTLY